MPLRLVDAGIVSALRSQAVYHGVARALTPETPNTIILVAPAEPYVCIGYHQELQKEVDVGFCQQQGIPIVRREVGGGAVYLDREQLFTQWVFQPRAFPMRIEERFKLHAYPIVETYKSYGIEAYFRPINDIQVNGKKIGGMGAAKIGQAEVLVGSLMFDFDFELMAKVLNVPDEKFRDKVYQSLREYMTTMRKELETLPDREEAKESYLRHCEKIFNAPVEVGEFTDREWQEIEKVEKRFASEEWLYHKGGHARPAVKIHSGVWVGETSVKTPGGLIRVTIRLKDNHIDDLSLSGDITFYPQTKFETLEKALLGTEATRTALQKVVETFYRKEAVQTPGVEPADWVSAITNLAESIAKN